MEFSDKTVILYKLCYTPYISYSVPFPKEYGIKCTENVSFDVIQVTFILIGLLYYWSLLLCFYLYLNCWSGCLFADVGYFSEFFYEYCG